MKIYSKTCVAEEAHSLSYMEDIFGSRNWLVEEATIQSCKVYTAMVPSLFLEDSEGWGLCHDDFDWKTTRHWQCSFCGINCLVSSYLRVDMSQITPILNDFRTSPSTTNNLVVLVPMMLNLMDISRPLWHSTF